MSDLLNKQIVLKLNKNFWAIDFITVKTAFSEICSLNPRTGKPPQVPIDIIYEQNEDGTYDIDRLVTYRPVSVDEWFTLPVRNVDLGIQCAHRLVRVPTITVCSNYNDVPEKKPKFSPEAIWQRDNGTCQATGRRLARDEGDLGHNIAKAHGGRRSWDNIALLDKRINRLQGTKTFAEMGWNHIKPKAPRGTRVLITADQLKHPSQIHFLQRN